MGEVVSSEEQMEIAFDGTVLFDPVVNQSATASIIKHSDSVKSMVQLN